MGTGGAHKCEKILKGDPYYSLQILCQMNRLDHSSPVMYNVEGKTQKLLEKLNIKSKKIHLILTFFYEVFSDHLS